MIGQGSRGLLDLGANYFVSDQSLSSLQLGSDEQRHPEKVADMMDYMVQIVQASRQFKGAPWAKYDTAHRMQAKREGLSLVDTTP